MIDFIDTSIGGHPSGPVDLFLTGSRDRLIATTFSDNGTFREGTLVNGVRFNVERLGNDDSVWDVWLGLPHDLWLERMGAEHRAEEMLAMRTRVWRDDARNDND